MIVFFNNIEYTGFDLTTLLSMSPSDTTSSCIVSAGEARLTTVGATNRVYHIIHNPVHPTTASIPTSHQRRNVQVHRIILSYFAGTRCLIRGY